MKLLDWLDERTGHRAAMQSWLDHPIVGGASWARAMGSALAVCLLLLASTGIGLSMGYSPSTQAAWASVHHLQHASSFGPWLRGLHRAASETLVVLAHVHVLALVLRGSYRKPGELAWALAVLFVPIVLLACITGNTLQWDQQAYWARTVELNITQMAPGGDSIARLATGGEARLGNATLTRAYALHVALVPLLAGGALWLRHAMHRAHGRVRGGSPWFPSQAFRDLALSFAAVVLCVILAWRWHGAPLGAPADPASDYPARPEWYLLWLFELRHRMPASLEMAGPLGVPPLVLALLLGLPLLDRREQGPNDGKDKGPRFRLRALVPVLLVGAGIAILTVLPLRRDARDAALGKELARWDARGAKASTLAMGGVPPEGPLAMLDRDPEYRGEKLFATQCATCHVLGEMGDAKKPTAPTLDGWGTEEWNLALLHDPDAAERFGNTPYKGEMPSMDVPKPDKPDAKPMTRDEMKAVAQFLSAQGDEPGDPPVARDAKLLAQGEQIVADRCTTCHLWKGEGDDGGEGIAPELQHYGSIAWTRAQIANPATPATYRENALDPARKGHMPRFDGDLSPADVDLLARWTRARGRNVPLR
jgi:ubiquinol-cytochrome c reductase cytochrome b subunit